MCVLAVDADGAAVLVRQFRYAAGAESLECVCGGREDGEAPEEAARRELREELGAEAAEPEPHGWVQLDGSVADCRSHLFVARRLTVHAPAREGTEPMRTVRLPLADARRAALDGRVRQAASVIRLLRATDPNTGG